MIAHALPMIFAAAVTVGVVYASVATALRLRRGHGISIIIPFRCADPTNPRMRNVEWLKRYWAKQFPGAEIIMGEDPHTEFPFSKSVAVNDGVSKSSGDVLVIVDADGYLDADSVLHCAAEIRSARKRGKKLWFVPYRQFYRLTEEASKFLLESDPANPYPFSSPLSAIFIMNDTDPKVGHWYGAMIQIMPREAFDTVGGWDTRFRGWGGEDHAAMRAMDTLYTLHKTLPGQVLHIWHPQLSPDGQARLVNWRNRMWEGQTEVGVNNKLSHRYYAAQLRPDMMRKLVDEGHKNNSPIDSPHTKSDKKRRTSI